MKKKLIGLLTAVILSSAAITTASAATEAQKLNAILNGWAHLDYVQCKTAGSLLGSWSTSSTSNTSCGSGYSDAFTGAAVFAFLSKQSIWPANLAAQYGTDVTNGVNYLLSIASVSTVSVNNSAQNICPGGSGTCKAVYWSTCSDSTYCTGFVATALGAYALSVGAGNVATATGPLAGMTWTQIAQGITNAYSAAQASSPCCGQAPGGWRYDIPSDNDSDMSTAQWGAISIGYDESIGAVTPAFVKTNLATYLAYQIKNGSAACYVGSTANGGCDIGPDTAENGAWLVSNAWAASASSTAAPLAFLNSSWTLTPTGSTCNSSGFSTWCGNFGHPYAMWSTYKGLEATIGLKDTTHITSLNSSCGAPNNLPGANSASGGVCNWWEDYNDWLVNNQSSSDTAGTPNKYWPGYSYWNDPLSTSIDVAILNAAALPGTITGNVPPTVPALSQWGLIALAIILVFFAAMKMRGPQTT